MSLYKTYATDKNLESGAGVKLEYPDGVSLTIHRAGGSNRKFLQSMDAKIKPHRRQIQLGTIDRDLSDKLIAEVYAESVIKGWSGVTDENGNDLPFTKQNVVKLLLDLPDLFNDIKAQADTLANFRKEELEEEAKN